MRWQGKGPLFPATPSIYWWAVTGSNLEMTLGSKCIFQHPLAQWQRARLGPRVFCAPTNSHHRAHPRILAPVVGMQSAVDWVSRKKCCQIFCL